MTKLDALKKLADAYYYLHAKTMKDYTATAELLDAFGRVRCSLRIDDLAPCKEGFNGKGPRFF